MDTDDFKRIYENASAALADPVGPYSIDEAIEPLSQMDAGDVDRLLRDLLTAIARRAGSSGASSRGRTTASCTRSRPRT